MSKVVHDAILLSIRTSGNNKLILRNRALCLLFTLALFISFSKGQTIVHASHLPSLAVLANFTTEATDVASIASNRGGDAAPTVNIVDQNGNDLPNAAV